MSYWGMVCQTRDRSRSLRVRSSGSELGVTFCEPCCCRCFTPSIQSGSLEQIDYNLMFRSSSWEWTMRYGATQCFRRTVIDY
jgi:hypothetical protein